MAIGAATAAEAAGQDMDRAIDAATFDRAHQSLLSDKAIQFDFSKLDPPKPPPKWLESLDGLFSALGPVSRLLFWAVVAVAAIALLYVLYRFVRSRLGADRAPEEEAATPDWRPEEAAARELLRDAETLAARGDYAGAARMLLWRSIEDIQARRPNFVKPALTSREIARAEALPAAARSAFALIAGRVEASHFAERGLDEAGWHDCRKAYEDFAFDRSWA